MAAAAIQSLAGKGLENGEYRDLDRDHPDLDRFRRMLKAGLPQGAIENAMLRDGILPSSLFDSPLSNPTGPALPLQISKPAEPKAPAKKATLGPSSDGKPPPGMTLIEEMKWRQANQPRRADASGPALKFPERKKSVVQPAPQRMVALKASGGLSKLVEEGGKAEAPKVNPALAPALKPTPKPVLPGAAPAAKYTAPVYSNVLKATPKPDAQKEPQRVVTSFVKAKESISSPATKSAPTAPPAEAPKVEIEFTPLPTDILLPPPPPLMEEVLPDGSKVVKDKDGGLTQTGPNGVILRIFADNSMKQTDPDGTVIETSADGRRVIQTNPDGTRIEESEEGTITCFPSGHIVRRMKNGEVENCFPDGTIAKELPNKERIQTNPDGVVIHTFPDGTVTQKDGDLTITQYPDGRTVQTKGNIEITMYSDGSSDQLDKATGKKLHKSPDGVVSEVKA